MVVDIVAFVSKGDFPRSRLGEKQRGKILASWVTRKMKTIAQFGIRDADRADSQITEVAEPRSAVGSIGAGGSSLKNVETVTTPQPQPQQPPDYISIPTGVSEMPQPYESSIVESPPLPLPKDDDEDTPTEPRDKRYPQGDNQLYHTNSANAPQATISDYSDIQNSQPYANETYQTDETQGFDFAPLEDDMDSVPTLSLHHDPGPPPPRFDSKPTLSRGSSSGMGGVPDNDIYTLPSQQQARNISGGSGGGRKLRVANQDSDSDNGGDESWPQEAIRHMNLRGSSSPENKQLGGGRTATDKSCRPMAPQEDDFILTISDNDQSVSLSEEDDNKFLEVPSEKQLGSKKRKRDLEKSGAFNTSTKASEPLSKKQKKNKNATAVPDGSENAGEEQTGAEEGEDDGAMNSDFEFQVGDPDAGIIDGFDPWEINGDDAGSNKPGVKKGVDINELIAKRRQSGREKEKIVNSDEDDNEDEDVSEPGWEDEPDSENDSEVALEGDDSEEEDETLAADGFGMGVTSKDDDSDDIGIENG
ncbi:MAG: hypothetical protein Q9214_006427, partial [Letrouitia sp. 1 TL-2023]